jgi:hypothetical protein
VVCPRLRSSELSRLQEMPLSSETSGAYHSGADILEVPTWVATFIATQSGKLVMSGR